MKKLVFGLIAALGVALTSCSAFDSDPIEPKIIGSGSVQHDAMEGFWFVEIGPTRYAVTEVDVPDRNPRTMGKTQGIEPVEGMVVTLFTSPRMKGVQAIYGKQSVEQIEEFYHTNSTIIVIFIFCLIFLCFYI